MTPCDILLIIPLTEEFNAGVAPHFSIVETYIIDGLHYHRLDISNYRVYCLVLDAKGGVMAAVQTERTLGKFKPQLSVVAGIGGALDKDLALGDAFAATQVLYYPASSKAEAAEAGYRIRYSGEAYKPDSDITKLLQEFERSEPAAHQTWQQQAQTHRTTLSLPESELALSRPAPRIHSGHLASGETVGASSAYVNELLGIDRDLKVIEMESGGVAASVLFRSKPGRVVVLRGISDLSNEIKGLISPAWRAYAMYNAIGLFKQMLLSRSFQLLLPPKLPSEQEEWTLAIFLAHSSLVDHEKRRAFLLRIEVRAGPLPFLTVAPDDFAPQLLDYLDSTGNTEAIEKIFKQLLAIYHGERLEKLKYLYQQWKINARN